MNFKTPVLLAILCLLISYQTRGQTQKGNLPVIHSRTDLIENTYPKSGVAFKTYKTNNPNQYWTKPE